MTFFTAACIQSKGNPVADLYEDLAAKQKASTPYKKSDKPADDLDVIDPLRFLQKKSHPLLTLWRNLKNSGGKPDEKKFYVKKLLDL